MVFLLLCEFFLSPFIFQMSPISLLWLKYKRRWWLIENRSFSPENEPPSNKISNLLRKFSLDSANVFLLNLSGPDLLLHFPGFLRVPAEQQKAGSQPVQPVDGSEVLEAVLLRQDEDHRVVAVAATRVNLKKS